MDHLVNCGMNDKMSENDIKLNQVKINNEQTKVQYERRSKRKRQGRQIIFTDIRSLYNDEIKPSKGIKLIQGPFVLQDKNKKTPTIELINSLNSRRLSKQQYKRVKQMTEGQNKNQQQEKIRNNSRILQQKKKQEKQSVMERIRSEKHFSRRNGFLKKSTITINNAQLLQNLISGPINNVLDQQIVKRNQQFQEDFNPQISDTLDSFSKEAIRLGTLQKRSKSVSSIMQSVKFPKINLPRSIQQIPKYRSKIKDGSELRRKLRIRFQEKLKH